MKIAVVGIGGVGGYFGGNLARHYTGKGEVEIVFVARGKHLEEITKNGLELITQKGSFKAMPDRATDNPADQGAFDLVLFCVKAYDLEESARLLRYNVDEKSVVITLLNGVDNRGRLKDIFPRAEVLDGGVYISGRIICPGVVQQLGGACKLFFGAEDGATEKYLHTERLLRDAGIDAEFRTDIQTVVWDKYLFISPVASATAYLGKNFGEILEDGTSRGILESLVKEVERVGRAMGVPVPEDAPKVVLDKVASFPYETQSSMQVDFEKGGRTELETFTGFIVRSAGRRGIAVPHHDEIYRILLERMEKG